MDVRRCVEPGEPEIKGQERFKTIDKAKSLEYEVLEDEKQAMLANISRLLKDNDNLLKGQSTSYKEEEGEVEGPEEYA